MPTEIQLYQLYTEEEWNSWVLDHPDINPWNFSKDEWFRWISNMRETVHSIQQMQSQDKGCDCNCDGGELIDLIPDYQTSENEFVNCHCTLCGPKGRDGERHCRNRVLDWLAMSINGSLTCFSCMSCADNTGVIAPVSEMSQTIQQMQPSSSSSGQMPQRDSAMSSSPAGFALVPPAIGIPGNTKEAAAERLKEFLRWGPFRHKHSTHTAGG